SKMKGIYFLRITIRSNKHRESEQRRLYSNHEFFFFKFRFYVVKGELQNEFPKMSGFSVSNFWYMSQFYLEYQGNVNLVPMVREISWSKHLVILSKCKNKL